MPIANVQDTSGVERKLQDILSSSDVNGRLKAIRELFVGILDYDNADQLVSLESSGNAQLPKDAHVAARRDGVTVAYIPLDDAPTNRVNGIVVSAAAKTLGNILSDDLLLLFTNRDMDQLHIISPDLSGSRPKLQRLVAYRDQLQRTVPQQIANMWDSYGNKGKTLREAIAEVFNVEPVTKDFFETYRQLFEDAEAQIKGFGAGKDEEEQRHLFTQTLFNRLMFVYFLSRKGWLKFESNTDYLNALWSSYRTKDSTGDFYITRLRTLFFKGLNNPDARSLPQEEKALIGDVPFLNGGLFEETNLDQRKGIEIPDAIIGQVLDRLFERFNFTVMESTPYDVEVAVDPEMLGKVFEELVTERHSSGAYYTPRPVVSFMCREALKGYLEGKETGLDQDAIARFVDEHDTSGISLIGAPRISEALSEVTVVDPACGSGAYLLGMMQELVELQTILYNIVKDDKKIYDLKLEIIQRNLYGVDIDEFAVNIAMLRMWLSLAIDYEGEKPEPLPNLDFKVICGDSLLGPDPSAGVEIQGTLGQDAKKLQRLGQLKADYMRASLGTDKERLKKDIQHVEQEVRELLGGAGTPDGVVDWRVEFVEVFADKGGFDIGIANPPYVRYQNIGSSLSTLKQFYNEVLAGNSDLYCYFYCRTLQTLRDGGVHVFVCSNSWLDVAYGTRLQDYLGKETHVRAIYQSSVERQFSTALINTLVSVIYKTQGNDQRSTSFISLTDSFENSISNADHQQTITMTRAQLRDLSPVSSGKFQGYKWGAKQLRAPNIYHAVIQKAKAKLIRLSEVASVTLGITTGANNYFYLDEATIGEFGIEDRFLQPAIRTSKESRSIALDPKNLPYKAFVCHASMAQVKGTGAERYIRWGESQGINTRPFCASRTPWYDLGARQPMPMAMHELIDTTAYTYLSAGSLLYDKNFDVVRPTKADPFAIGISMNSIFFQLAVHSFGRENFGGGLIRVATHELSTFFIVKPELLPEIDQSIFNGTEWDILEPSPARIQLDEVVFDALDLTHGERDAIYEAITEIISKRRQRAKSA